MENWRLTSLIEFLGREWNFIDVSTLITVIFSHCLALLTPFQFNWGAFWLSLALYFLLSLGITLGYHRNLAHRSLKLPKWLEYFFAYCGVLTLHVRSSWKNLSLMVGRSPQLRELWVACFCASLWFIWQTRNKVRYEGITPDVAMACRLINGHVYASSRIATGHMFNNIQELCVLKRFGATCMPRCAPKIYEVNWHPPIIGWFKVNTNGAWKRGEDRSGYGGVFRDYRGEVVGAFSSSLDIPSSITAEVMAVIKAIELAWVRDWKHIWLEVDSSLILNFLHSPQMVPWQLQVAWKNCVHHISMMQFRCSHIFREGNQVADALANFGASDDFFCFGRQDDVCHSSSVVLYFWKGSPVDWVSTHRYHHQFTDTKKDPHCPIMGLWFSHIGWIFNYRLRFESYERQLRNAADLRRQAYYRFLHHTYLLHPVALGVLLYALGGLCRSCEEGERYLVIVQVKEFKKEDKLCVNLCSRASAIQGCEDSSWLPRDFFCKLGLSHIGKASMGYRLFALPTPGEGWHNNHHAFDYSAQQGLEWWQIDLTWYLIRFLQVDGLATDVKPPTENQKKRKPLYNKTKEQKFEEKVYCS
ncbi:putative ribonuclease H-like domain, acyl-CoA desaturase [Rosa chinensis]|uniref:Putative ribonuclease H-like domain, acyl-CoA desaturase n=1 Tax=Rosa chinensis TaxID=74649 RepID=A0A2P6Q211_ROSCH|nr:putative ribonuclease H-like domain, acyl-CoA desaturase [Rosa chinensis]